MIPRTETGFGFGNTNIYNDRSLSIHESERAFVLGNINIFNYPSLSIPAKVVSFSGIEIFLIIGPYLFP